MNRFVPFLMAIAGLLHSPASHAIGDSTGCAGLSWGALIDVLAKGSPQDLERAIEENHRVEGSRFSYKSKVPGETYYYAGCGVAGADALLAEAVKEGNVALTKYLLEKGAKPDKYLFRSCSRPSGRAGTAADGRRETFKLAVIAADGAAQHNDLFRCEDGNVLKAYFAAGAKVDPQWFMHMLTPALNMRLGGAPHEREEMDRVVVFLVDGGLLRNGQVLQKLLSLCVAPVTDYALGCRELATSASVDYVALTLANTSALDRWLRKCDGVYPAPAWQGPADCGGLRRVPALQYESLEVAVQHANAGRSAQYEATMRDLWRTLAVAPEFSQYRSTVLLHLGRAAALTCRNDAEQLLKSGIDLQQALDKEWENDAILARIHELAYYYFDHRRYQEALPLLQRIYLGHPTFLGVSGTAQLHADMAKLHNATGDVKSARKSEKAAVEIGSRVRRGDVLFRRVPYPERCPR